MAISDKLSNKSEELGGKGKETVGEATGNEQLQAEGKADQSSAGLKQAGEKLKDAAKDVKGAVSK
ncbi:CsbD family protein [Nocardioides bruguierae]|uniref:CsbD family protein n=1 Tax=Nocardioides bruguierae TaxID=2945102 RepID=A0A9X2IFB6_9ACTN|nr:CsbD family protein [Nocardioides bruguierae]MCL8024090.1 CsbD family protein [Nocardioides bruguierae]MCM0620244.1 CsbD family protein [Nocardioides bruguierae]